MKGLSVLGSTGSIGVQTLDVVRLHPERFRVVALAAGSNLDLVEAQAREFRPEIVSVAHSAAAEQLASRLADLSESMWIGHSAEGLSRAATAELTDLVIMGLPGSAGLVPTFQAVEAGKDVALATKEVLVMAGQLFMETAQRRGVKVLPVDSEQSAIFQCLQGNQGHAVERILLTASGGPFRELSREQMANVTLEQTLAHPRWRMGPKVTVDSATLMNKGFEVIEARWLFDVPATTIEVVIHPQSIVHSMVEFSDGSIIAQLGATDMRIPISYAMAYPERISSGTSPLSFPEVRALTFFEPDMVRFPLLRTAIDVLRSADQAASIILNCADEVAVELFLAGRIAFKEIPDVVTRALDTVPRRPTSSLSEVMDLHEQTRREVRSSFV